MITFFNWKICKALLCCKKGVTAVEYGLIASGIALTIIPAVLTTGINIQAVFGKAGDGLATIEAWPNSTTFSFINGNQFLMAGIGAITKDLLMRKLSAEGLSPYKVTASDNVSMNIQGLTVEDILAMRGGANSILFRNFNGAGVTFNGTPPPGGSISSSTASGITTYNYLNSGGAILATVTCVYCT